MSERDTPPDDLRQLFMALNTRDRVTLNWLIKQISARFAAAERFDPKDPAVAELAATLAAEVMKCD